MQDGGRGNDAGTRRTRSSASPHVGRADADSSLESPSPPWRPSAKQSRSRRRLSSDAIVEIAIRIVDTEGIDAVSMRRVAGELGTGPASLYAHVANKDELLQLVHDRVIAAMPPLRVKGRTWQQILQEYARSMWDEYQRHNDLARLSFGDVATGPAVLDRLEVVLKAMLDGGVPARTATWAIDRMALYVVADIIEGWHWQHRFGGETETGGPAAAAYFGRIAEYFASLPKDRYPTVVDNFDVLTQGGSEERFELGLRLLIDGIAAQAASRRRARKQ